jgi:hypothetical protein
MLKEGLAMPVIQKVIGLSQDELEKIKEKNNISGLQPMAL